MSTRVMKKFESVADGIDNMVAAAKYDYTLSNFNEQMNEKFANSFMIKQGQKYIKIGKKSSCSSKMGSVWGFVVATDNDPKFSKGAILKAAGWKTPARNFARGNVYDAKYAVCWTGAQ